MLNMCLFESSSYWVVYDETYYCNIRQCTQLIAIYNLSMQCMFLSFTNEHFLTNEQDLTMRSASWKTRKFLLRFKWNAKKSESGMNLTI